MQTTPTNSLAAPNAPQSEIDRLATIASYQNSVIRDLELRLGTVLRGAENKIEEVERDVYVHISTYVDQIASNTVKIEDLLKRLAI